MPFKVPKGLNADIVRYIWEYKKEPQWMLDFRLNALALFESIPMPKWGPNLNDLSIDDIYYYLKPASAQHTSWQTVPDTIKQTFNALGIPQAEQKFLAGVGAQYESEIIYKRLKSQWKDKGVIFVDTGCAMVEYPELFSKYFATVIAPGDNKFAALNSAVWSGGSFIYVPPGVHIDMPLQAYFRINTSQLGQFERTLIIADTGSFVHYVEGCSAPVYQANSLHSAVVELIALPGSHIRYTTIQNWSSNVYNLVTKRALAHEDAFVEWVDGNFGSKITMKYPSIILKGARSKGHVISLADANAGQHQDAGSKIIHIGPDTTSYVVSKSISKNDGHSTYRGLLKIAPTAARARSRVQCDALLLGPRAISDTYPTVQVMRSDARVEHEASVSKISQEQLFYMNARGILETQAQALLVTGFVDAFVKELPMEYAIEINRLIAHQMEGSVG
jgi:Fe-S cluster assembly protein SufB